MTKEELRKSLDYVNEERERLQRELERKDNIINEYENKGYDIATERADFLLEIQDLQQELQRKDNNWSELKDYINRFIYMLNGILDRDIYEQCQLEDFTQIMDKIKELEIK